MEFRISLDSKAFTTKPSNKETKGISSRIGGLIEVVSIEKLKGAVLQGKTFSPSVFKDGQRLGDNWESQQCFGLDFDNKLNFRSFQDRCHLVAITPALVYTTFGDKGNGKRFRAIFVMDEVITDPWFRDVVQSMLLRIFPEADQSCNDAARIFYGGKKCLLVNEVCVSYSHLSLALVTYWRSKDCRNAVRAQEAFAVEYHGAWDDHIFVKEILPQKTQNPYALYNNRANGFRVIAPIFCDTKLNSTATKPRLTDNIRRQLIDGCILVKNLSECNGPLPHAQLFHMATNIFQFEGGRTWFMKMLDSLIAKDLEVPEKKVSFGAYIGKYKPQSCQSAGCPYFKMCQKRGTNILHQIPVGKHQVRQVASPPSRVSLDETRLQLQKALQKAYSIHRSRVTVIKVDPGVGKTEEILKLPLSKTFVAFPTHKLKEEAYLRYIDKAGSAWKQKKRPTLPQHWESEALEIEAKQLGGIFEHLRKYLTQEEDVESRTHVYEYMRSIETLREENLIFGTHAKAFDHVSDEIDTYILDEDVSSELLKIVTVSSQDVKMLLDKARQRMELENDDEMQPILDFLSDIHSIQDGTIGTGQLQVSEGLWNDLIRSCSQEITSPVVRLRSADVYMRQKDRVLLGMRKSLRSDKKYIILSATASEEIYRKLLGQDLDFVDLTGTELEGRLYLHPEKSYSRTSIGSDADKFLDHCTQAVTTHTLDGVITFKEFRERLESRNVPVFAHFGATEGLDGFKGKNLGIFGTPYPTPAEFKIMAYMLDGKTRDDSGEFSAERLWEFEVSLWCPKDPLCKKVQLWLMESQLIQAIGRARLVTENCEVHLFSKFPISGGILMSYKNEEPTEIAISA